MIEDLLHDPYYLLFIVFAVGWAISFTMIMSTLVDKILEKSFSFHNERKRRVLSVFIVIFICLFIWFADKKYMEYKKNDGSEILLEE